MIGFRTILWSVALAAVMPPVAVTATAVDFNRAWAAGYRAGFTCSALWNGAGKSLADIERDELTHIYPEIEGEIRRLTADVDLARRQVRVAYRDDMPPRVAQWRGRQGCVTLPIGTDPAAVDGVTAQPRGTVDGRS